MAKIADLKDDLTGELGSVGSRGNGSRTGSDQYMHAISAGPVSPIPAQPPHQMALAPQQRSSLPPPMDASASVHQMQQRAAMESDVMRPPYSQPYGQLAYATQPGFQGAPVGALQMPVYAAHDSCSLQGPSPRMSPAAQMQLVQQQRMAQLQAQQLQAQQQAAQAKAGQACLKGKKMKLKASSDGGDCGKQMKITNLIWALVVVLLIGLLIAALVIAVKSYKYSQRIASTLSSPIVGA